MQVSPRVAVATLALAVAAYLHGLGSLHILANGDEMIYAQIARATATSGHWLPLESEMPDMVNTKPPLLIWQGILATDWGRRWTLTALRWPSVAWTFATAGMVGLLAWRASGMRHVGILAAAIHLAFLSTYRYGRPFLTNPPETFWMFACFFIMAWWRPRSFESRLVFPTIIGLCAGAALFAKSFAQLVPIGAGLAAWHVHEVRRPDGGVDWRRLALRSAPGLVWTATLALAIFALWFVFDPDPAAIWREFVVGENFGKMKAGRANYLVALLWGRVSVWWYAASWFTNVGLLAFPLLGTMIRAWQHRREATVIERLLWIWAAVLFIVFMVPTQRSGRYLLEAMPGIAVLMALHWHRLLPSAFATVAIGAGAVVGLVAWLSVALVRELGTDVFTRVHWAIIGGAAAIAAAPLMARRHLAACAVPAAIGSFLAVSSFLTAFDPPRGGYPPEAVAAARGRIVHVPQNFRGGAERNSFLLPGALIRGYPEQQPGPGALGVDDLVVVVTPFGAPAPPGAIASRIELTSRHTPRQLLDMAAGRLAENIFCSEWLVRR
ncbi:MAG: glycosyl transferase family 39 [Planctomycetia bacterium]|nr:glycosyl transferase family 39 [Planctomycetia bacterium]